MFDKNFRIIEPDDVINIKIYLIRGKKIMLDHDLSALSSYAFTEHRIIMLDSALNSAKSYQRKYPNCKILRSDAGNAGNA